MVSPRPAPLKRLAMAWPVTISLEPGRNGRPATSRTWGRSCSPTGDRPRMMTLEGLAAAPSATRLLREISTTVSFDSMRRPPAPRATWGRLSTMAAGPRSMPLCTSVPEARRVTTTLSGLPVSTRVFFSPASSISTVAKTNTTRAMPPAVRAVVSLRAARLRRE